ncbi:hypothetical protein [Algisphaera agarilytica]|uniref:Cellobiose phosphorylase n=1 Tax=Algisphaera agarilytica TaxID=1385975 RepID=A0A7X0LKF8_9BACT|nr:hypothetical protein [Algisphaera agarilytica]MBB6429872.1 hypothetical protein [Algisphaera agarilytica]
MSVAPNPTVASSIRPQTASGSLPEGFVTIDGVEMYRITDSDQMPAFLMSVVSDSDLWMFLSSRGGLTAGRVDPDHALFPYETDDILHKCHPYTGSATLIWVSRDGEEDVLWEPFNNHGSRPNVTRNLYKSVAGNRVIFEEVQHDLGLTFRYQWAGCDRFGFVRSARLTAHDSTGVTRVELLDGVLNLIPSGLTLAVMQQFSCLTNAYSRVEIDVDSRLTVYAMSSLLVDKAEPAEALRANVAWCRGLPEAKVVIDDDSVEQFREGQPLTMNQDLKGRRGAYLLHTPLALKPGESVDWDIVADVDRSQAQAEALRQEVLGTAELKQVIQRELAGADANLVANVASSDGLQCTGDRSTTAHHFANVLFNNMRGGVFADGYSLPGEDFVDFVESRNTKVAKRHAAILGEMTGSIDYQDLLAKAEATGDGDLSRLAMEYLPITFSRRHGDPSRPWNKFAIHLQNPDGSRILNYQGNWRDIFQNWESMCVSFPGYFESIVAKFVNASTADGFNPYRVMRSGIDWEAPEPDNPWASIGYWGDHQIIYLLKLLEHSKAFHPGKLETMLGQRQFTYADVPYRIASYAELCRDPHNTIAFDHALENAIGERVEALGADGKLLHDAHGKLVKVSLAEKLLVPALSKLSNLVVDGGIWMNTQRPEWNDANNALVGHGISMVTLCYLRRYAAFMADLLEQGEVSVELSAAVDAWLAGLSEVLSNHAGVLDAPALSDIERRTILDELGMAFEAYRTKVYHGSLGSPVSRSSADIVELLKLTLRYLDHSIDANRREEDGLYHSYNLLKLDGDVGSRQGTAGVDTLYPMLEGQVAVLSTGRLDAATSASLIESMYQSSLYRADQNTFLLYPDRPQPGYFAKNDVPAASAEAIALLKAMLDAGDTRIVERDVTGRVRFHSDFAKAGDMVEVLDGMAEDPQFGGLVESSRQAVLDLYEQVFNHRAFTGRSGAMYAYEGLGSIYWHMVSKLLLAAQESYQRAIAEGASAEEVQRLAEAYYGVRGGLSANKTAREYGAFPTDPYSHTPGHRGAQQPGMTGQVKEEVLTRLGELGVRIDAGQVTFSPSLLRGREFLGKETSWDMVGLNGETQQVTLPKGSLGFTYAQVPVVMHRGNGDALIRLQMADGTRVDLPGNALGSEHSAELFDRRGTISQIDVVLSADQITLD